MALRGVSRPRRRTPAACAARPMRLGAVCRGGRAGRAGSRRGLTRTPSRAPASLSRTRARARAGSRSSSRTALVCACDHVDGAEPDIQRGADRGPPRAAGHPQRLFQGGDPRQPQGPPRLLRRVFPENGGHPRWCVPRGARRRAHTARADDTTPATQTRSPDPSSQTTRKRSRGLVYSIRGRGGDRIAALRGRARRNKRAAVPACSRSRRWAPAPRTKISS